MGHPALTGLPVGPVRQLLGPPPTTRGSRSLQLPSCDGHPTREWQNTGNDRADTTARELRARVTERDGLLARSTLTEADHARLDQLDQLDQELRERIAILR